MEKYHFPEDEALSLSDFLLPMLEIVPSQRASAQEMLSHPWLQLTSVDLEMLFPSQRGPEDEQPLPQGEEVGEEEAGNFGEGSYAVEDDYLYARDVRVDESLQDAYEETEEALLVRATDALTLSESQS